MKVYLLTTGDGSDGSEWNVQSIHSTMELAQEAQSHFERPRYRKDGSSYTFDSQIEEWEVDDAG